MKNLIFISIIIGLGGLLSGYDTGVISGALLYIQDDWKLNETLSGALVGILLIGAGIGAFTNGILADIFGRKKLIILTSIIFFLFSILCAISPNIETLIFSRFFIGIAIGIVTFLTPLYLSEISPKKHRGALVSLFQLGVTAGILFSYLTNSICANFEYNWRLMLLVGVVPSIILALGMIKMPDSPRWLALKGKINEAKTAFLKIQPDIDVENEIKEIQNTIGEKQKIKFQKWMLTPILIGASAMFIQQFSGINTIIYYAPTILKQAGFSTNESAIHATIIIGVINFLMTFIAILFTDKFGRKPLLYAGLAIMTISLFTLSFSFLSASKWLALTSTVIYIACFAFSLGPIMILIVSEIFPLSIRGVGMSLSMMANFVFNFLVSFSFLPMLHKFGQTKCFLIYAIVCVLAIPYVKYILPETKGVSLEEIEQKLRV